MTRGRRKDMTIPPSRALLQQRDYRARKARYVADLEERCKQTEEENARLKERIDVLGAQLRAAGQSAAQRTSPSPEMVRAFPVYAARCCGLHGLCISHRPRQAAATNELMHNLSAAAHSIAHFQQVAFGPPSGSEPSSASSLRLPPIQNHTPTSLATPSFTPSPLPQPHHRLPPSPRQRIELPPLHAIHRDLFRGPGESSSYSHQQARIPGPPQAGPSNSGYSESECCGGYLDCNGLVEDEDEDGITDDDATSPESSNPTQRMSDVRSTRSSSGPEDAGSSSGRLPQPQ
ncbi:uncharacterized protein C8Q71DRAFT_514811 [Rhodofomes roseus]|uniref:BZIP domain-containing protein n=1 Tax=Rhodofomes roseus TaxID=34475 RepID=A0A4Y9Z249_9APHY|nr:uncharacterized protein C8Q71DRAFT_514811 [Rhodofomes roseus]KAH9839494.1 hypothetical protein C8Q71DRAFT_514811 [Rhodofomes roseus]TFY67931.1 hypothetical protein EVJ58_g1324 [Rhodofomes roseus]